MEAHSPRVALFADQDVGLDALRFVADHHANHLALVVTTSDNEIAASARSAGCTCIIYEALLTHEGQALLKDIDLAFLAWWPTILPSEIITAVGGPVVNFHPSLLPYNRGKHYNFWTLVEDTPFGVSLHLVTEQVDAGDILFQESISKSWEDTGGTLYLKAKIAILRLFKRRYDDIVCGRYVPIRQQLAAGSFHRSRELEPASRIDLAGTYSARQLLNLLRARTFDGKPACFFLDDGKRYEVRIRINEVSSESD